MDRFVIRTLDDFWALVEAHRGELALRDLGLRHKRAPHVDTAFEALARLGLAPRWPGPAAMFDALRSETRALGWSARDLAERLQSSARTAERVLASDHTPTFDSALRWADAVHRPFHVDRDPSRTRAPRDAASPWATPASDSPPGAADVTDRSVLGPEAATLPARPGDTPVPGPEAATDPADDGDTTGHDETLSAVGATDPATLSDTSGPPSAHRSRPATEAADRDDRSGHGPRAPVSGPGALALVDMSQETCISGHDRGAHALAEDDADTPDDDGSRGPPIDTSGPTSLVSRASTPDFEPDDDGARKEVLQDPPGPAHARGMMRTVELRRGGEVIFQGEAARDQVLQTLKALVKLPCYAGADAYVDGRRVRTKKRRPRTDEIGLHIAEALRPVVEMQQTLADRQAAMEHQTRVANALTDGLKELAAQISTIQPPSFLSLIAKSIYEEFMPKEGPK
ncbi:MAG: hypothetical protein R3B09_13065 [Nannocystaceae bacterium]